MPVHNSNVSEIFSKMADLLEIEGYNRFRSRACRDAVRTITGLPKSVKDILEEGEDLSEMMEHFTDYDDVKKVISQGKTRSTVALRSGLYIDLRVVPPPISYGAALHYFTGSKALNITIRKLGVKKEKNLMKKRAL